MAAAHLALHAESLWSKQTAVKERFNCACLHHRSAPDLHARPRMLPPIRYWCCRSAADGVPATNRTVSIDRLVGKASKCIQVYGVHTTVL